MINEVSAVTFRQKLGEMLNQVGRNVQLNSVLPWFEGFQNMLVKSIAYGLFAVDVDCDTGPRDIIRPDVEGLLVVPGGFWRAGIWCTCLMNGTALQKQFGVRTAKVCVRFPMLRVPKLWEDLLSRPLKNVFEAVDARQKQAKKRSLCMINEHFELVFNTAAATQIVFQRPVRDEVGS